MTKLHTYALIKALFDQNKDYFDALCPLIMGVLSSSSFQDLTTIQNNFKKDRHIDIPIHILKTTCARAKSRGYVDQTDNARTYRINKEGQEYLKKLEPIDEVERRTNSFLSSAMSFFTNKGKSLDREQIRNLIESFIQDNLAGVIDFINPKESSLELNDRISRQDSVLLIDFIKEIQDSKPDEYNQFKELVFGSILSSLLCAENSSDIIETEKKSLKKGAIFFDSNIVLSLLGLDPIEKNTAAKELFNLLSNLGFKLKVFDFTVDEICRVMNGYITNKNYYPKDLPVDSIYSVLRAKGWGVSDINEFISNAEEKIEDLGIEIFPTDVNLQDYKSPNENLRSKIAVNKTKDISGLSTTHDLAAIDKIREIRKKAVRKIEDAEAFFLTADFSLQRTVLFALGHNDNGTLSEVVLDRVLANILWLKNPKLNLPLNTIIATHSRDLLIDRRVWDRFYTVLGKLRNEGTITEEKIDNLFYHRNITNILQEFSRRDIDKINEELVMEVVEEATLSLSAKEKVEAANLATAEGRLFEAKNETELKEQEHNDQLIVIKKGLRQKGHTSAKVWIILTVIPLTLIALFLEICFFQWLLVHISGNYIDLIYYPYSGAGIVIASGTIWIARIVGSKLISYLEKIFYRRLLKQVKLTPEEE